MSDDRPNGAWAAAQDGCVAYRRHYDAMHRPFPVIIQMRTISCDDD